MQTVASPTAAAPTILAPYTGPIEVGMVFDYEPGKKHRYERMTIYRKEGANIWCRGRAGETFHTEPEFRNFVVFVAAKQEPKPRVVPGKLEKRYEGPVEAGMTFDYEPGKKHQYERLRITEKKGQQLWAIGRSGQTFYLESEFRDHVVPVAS
ncbi:MAG: hypothetical protein ACKVQK_13345 [Burkholderiales bacterium]